MSIQLKDRQEIRDGNERSPRREHLLAIVEPTTGGDSTLEVAKETTARGGSVSVIMVITDRVRRDIAKFAAAEEINELLAEGVALARLQSYCTSHIGGSPAIETHFGPVRGDFVSYVTPDITAIAVPERLATGKVVQLLSASTGLPVIVTPNRAA